MLFNLSERKGVVICIVVIIMIVIIPRHLLPKEHDLFLLVEPVEVADIAIVQASASSPKSRTASFPKASLKIIATKAKAQQKVQKFVPFELNSVDSGNMEKYLTVYLKNTRY